MEYETQYLTIPLDNGGKVSAYIPTRISSAGWKNLQDTLRLWRCKISPESLAEKERENAVKRWENEHKGQLQALGYWT